jgi:hypothetical protein
VDSISNQSHALDFGRELQNSTKKDSAESAFLQNDLSTKNTRLRERRTAGERVTYGGGESQEEPDEKQNVRKGRRA